MAKTGVELGSHSLSHADLAAPDRENAAQEFRASRERFEQALGAPADCLAYLFSRLAPAVKKLAQQSGYRPVCSNATDCGVNANHDQHELRRINLLAADLSADFGAKVHGNWRGKLSWYRQLFGVWQRCRLANA